MFSVVVLFPWTRREKVSLVVFSVVVLFFDEKGCLVRRRRLLFERRRGFCGMRTEKRGVWLVTSLNMEKRSYWSVRHLERIFFVPEVGSLLKERIFA